ncbi:[FeFe] hydrogenase H-cluster radical SAM maturase HydE [Erysipelotrichaceae bacterium Oil+RF-744-GAM-WT-6]|uniref:[FeFe] hydrogenase H-cluster radical SAM maturase HydE n=1 Tax=Stecheria intestinalis TaxID=2606630 RepID=A0A7X2TGZ4_9FIRM|nr:[FeFe] hydrogenase H-cluster radical SAM maturase HydE [Stecheria intestinalis]MSS59001.1 [FeFe] hydrogenase H-cluster radical SAM maturase HydE [Stecheria intestinalis]
MDRQKELIEKLNAEGMLTREEFRELIEGRTEESYELLSSLARSRAQAVFGDKVYLRGIIEFSNYCRCDCRYCGIRHSNENAERYRMSPEEIIACASLGHEVGFRTFVLQSGEDLWYTDDILCDLIQTLKEKFPDSAITLSIGEKSRESYQRYYDAGADRYLLRHETASFSLYRKLHPEAQTLLNRMRCLLDLKEIGYQVGAGMMIGAPGQTTDDLLNDLFFMKELQPDMIGIGPFIPHKDTPFRDEPAGSTELTLFMLGVLRLMFPEVLLPATTALGTVDPRGREKGVMAGANVVMPNLSPVENRKKYLLYDNKICLSDDALKCAGCMSGRIHGLGYEVEICRGDAPRLWKK